ncbi:hypothetical protein GA830_19855 (plasmid) [Mesorhizobium sp. NBSH29]|uniref:hypothetical protein n=1 Tax=Mesorhizobium sp. NBSH29 TaxID=2654249 RepID=UPI00189685A3|nr:hypothetical protein [Mesorhizobium sp. NBSH29]QPC89071.1 hypothetical protein GA830_19855 [Mesorhizobium sp. NBSH29]
MMTREELYSAVWATPMARLAEQYGISGNGLAKIAIGRTFRIRRAATGRSMRWGKAPKASPMSKSDRSRSITIRPTPLPPPPIELPQEVKQQVDKARANESSILVQERLLRPHAVVASWLAEHEEKKRQARRERDPWTRKLYDPGEFTQAEHRKHRILDALFKAIERQGGKIKQGERRELFAEISVRRSNFRSAKSRSRSDGR